MVHVRAGAMAMADPSLSLGSGTAGYIAPLKLNSLKFSYMALRFAKLS